MKIVVSENSKALGAAAAQHIAETINNAIAEKGNARIVLSTGASQLDMFEALLQLNVDWSKVEMFHLDEYVGIEETHKASFRKYLKERFASKINLKNAYFLDGSEEVTKFVTEKLLEAEIDLGVIGIGENAHIAFNDPPADFDTKEAYHIVKLDDACKRQQVREGWFPTVEDVPTHAVSMTCYQILQCKKIISAVPHEVKAEAVYKTLTEKVNNNTPATLLKTHPNWTLYLDKNSASKVFPV
ncbi:MAG: glucosamine-6-phosphate deaminase [Clostridiales bacterium]|jgi:glucosamine-6-phosphate deaminase|nr:glucosamine-6-phosphate deaminase [Clostridiales bacterium]HOA34481.1 glucosamine-6-phosphate deaminase [Clostridiales bacterium]HOJ36393.1 glucosamine-6-phosphate deaminase [Clostridiales bacterium]HOL79811.1 glucosamine-6-phosphate deaminase [Clostridiales bacterium]HPU67548.1 glucosamine-6-phosphate deaminase [Clostridiales bacterium]